MIAFVIPNKSLLEFYDQALAKGYTGCIIASDDDLIDCPTALPHACRRCVAFYDNRSKVIKQIKKLSIKSIRNTI